MPGSYRNLPLHLRDGPLEDWYEEGGGGVGRAKYKTNIRARENQMKKTHVLQLTLKNIHAMA